MRMMMAALLVLCAGGLSAQAVFNVSGGVGSNEQDYLILNVDFGSSAASHTVSLSISGDSTTEGLSVFVADLDAVTASGFTSGAAQGSDVGTGTINLSFASGTYSGVHQFAVVTESDTGVGPVNYTGTLTISTLGSGAITQSESETFAPNGLTVVYRLFSRAVRGQFGVFGTGDPQPLEFLVNFGSVAQAITFAVIGEGSITGDLEVIEVLADGSTSSLGTLSGTGSDWGDAGSFTTSSRSGVVRIRVLADTASMSYNWTAVLPSTASVQALPQLSMSGTLPADGAAFSLFGIDFGTTTNTVMIQFEQFDETGSGNVSTVQFIDVDQLATTGAPSIQANEATFLSGSGYREFFLLFVEGSGAPVNYDIIMNVSVADANSTFAGTQLFGDSVPLQSVFDRGVIAKQSLSAGTYTHEFSVDFGSAAHTASLYASVFGSTNNTSMEVFELSGTGTPVSLGTVNSGTPATNMTTTSRSGIVTFRLVVTATAADDANYSVIFDSSVTVLSFGHGGGGDGGGDSGCSTGTDQGGLLLLLAVLCLGFVALRRGANEVERQQ